MPFGDFIAAAKGNVDLVTADDTKVVVDSKLKKLGLKLIGIPHTELRHRSRLLFNMFKPKFEDSILDAGCGVGHYALHYAMKYEPFTVIGMDISGAKIAQAYELKESLNSKAKFMIGDVTATGFPDECFDMIISSEVLEHIPNDGDALAELTRVLKPKGTLLLSFPSDSEHSYGTQIKFGHVRPGYSWKRIYEMAKENNLKVEKLSGYSFAFGKLAWFINEKTFKFPILAAALFPFLYALTYLDITKIGYPNGWCVKLSKM
jgi:ubiquinone/menaquinone biosynthesis C-methylase UbiE